MIAINTDASFREDLGRAGIAYCGALGRAAQVVDARDTMHAELLALVLAMSAAHSHGVEAVTFRHDAPFSHLGSRAIKRPEYGYIVDVRNVVRTMRASHPDWRLKQVPRRYNAEANVLARRALKLETGRRVQRAHCESAARREAQRQEAA